MATDMNEYLVYEIVLYCIETMMVGLVYLLRTGSDQGSPPCPQRKGNLGPVFLTELNTDRVCEKP